MEGPSLRLGEKTTLCLFPWPALRPLGSSPSFLARRWSWGCREALAGAFVCPLSVNGLWVCCVREQLWQVGWEVQGLYRPVSIEV